MTSPPSKKHISLKEETVKEEELIKLQREIKTKSLNRTNLVHLQSTSIDIFRARNDQSD